MMPDTRQYPIRAKLTGGILSDNLRKVLPNKEIGDMTAVYAFMRLIDLSAEEESEGLLEDALDQDTMNMDNGRVVFILTVLENNTEPKPTDKFDPTEISRKKSILEEIYPSMNKQYHTQYY